MLIKKLAISMLFAAVIMLGVTTFSHAETVLFSDNFDSDADGSVMNFNGLNNWNVSDGTIDYLKGYQGINCVEGGCLDMDGSSGDAGRIITKDTFDVKANQWYYLEGQISGSQRSGYDGIMFGLWDVDSDDILIGSGMTGVSYDFPFYSFRSPVMFDSSIKPFATVRFYVEGEGGDNVGMILDNVVFSTDAETVVPEPTSLLLLGTGLGAIGLAAWRRRK